MMGERSQEDEAAAPAENNPAVADRPGAIAAFPYDRMTVERFREAFPNARWRDDLKAWFVPGTTAERRIDRWLGRELVGASTYEDERGRDAFAFDPIESPYLNAGPDLRIVTPYSRTIVSELREVPWAWWDSDNKAWRVPYRSLEELRKHWPTIEAAARRNEPENRRKRQATLDVDARVRIAARNRERRRHRYPVPPQPLPPLERVFMTGRCGAVIFTALTGELVEADVRREHYPNVGADDETLIWAEWRKPTLSELVKTWPAKQPPGEGEIARGWWQPTLQELRGERRKARSIERAQETRRRTQKSDERL
jgi:hypothetical protein